MTTIAILFQVTIALGIANVWILRYSRPTPWRPSGATNMADEFRRYGLPDWVRTVVGTTKLTLAALLIVGVWYRPVAVVAAVGIAALMAGAVLAHVRVQDPWFKAVPAASMLVLSAAVVFTTSG